MPHVVHLFWAPETTEAFIQAGHFYLWVESAAQAATQSGKRKTQSHPNHLNAERLRDWLKSSLGVTSRESDFVTYPVPLPSSQGSPLPCPELSTDLDAEAYAWSEAEIEPWPIRCFCFNNRAINLINDIHFRLIFQGEDFKTGSDFLFWYYFTQSLRGILLKDHYIPALRYRARQTGKHPYEVYTGWEFLSPNYEGLINEAAERLPPAAAPNFEAATVLRHCAEVLLRQAAGSARLTQALEKPLADSWLLPACRPTRQEPWLTTGDRTLGKQWATWRKQLSGAAGETGFQLGFQLQEAKLEQPDSWRLEFRVVSRRDPSLQRPLADYWPLSGNTRQPWEKDFGSDFEQRLLIDLGQAARVYPALWKGMETAEPSGIDLPLEEAFAFLNETAWVLEDAGFLVSVPAWWTPEGRRRAKLRLRPAATAKKAARSATQSLLSLDQLLEYRYELTLGGEKVGAEEWMQLVETKTPLVQFRGQWVVLDRERMKDMLEFWRRQGEAEENLDMRDWLKRTADEAELFEVDPECALAEMLEKLRHQQRLQPIEDLPGLNAELREYQKRGVAWLVFLEQLGLSGCLADDMGLGKTLQVIARLVMAQGEAGHGPSLLIAPTSVLGNWRKEIERFAPQLTTRLHHGSERCKDEEEFAAAAQAVDVVIVSYPLALRDAKLFQALKWRRIVLDEAQNIKNPEAKQTKAIFKLNADYRWALTGTPVENRLLDLWSIFNFLNPGYLGKQAAFRKAFETPIQRDNDPVKSAMLKRLVEPFILRRVKTDPAIIRDLPDKVENKQYCNLSKEQASLYEAVVRDVEQQLEASEGIQRQGLMLSTLMKLKQICNHPAQFLQDDSAFTSERSHKLERLGDMLADALAEGESALIFTQFTEIGARLERYCRSRLDCQTYYLHGGTARHTREKMIAEFQNPDTPPVVFILSLKAGGVGITLTRANHVFHFDRWWNPAVEDQATDRAFRIGQTKNVFVHKFITLGTLEERIDQMIDAKKKIAGAIVGNDESWLTQLDNAAFKQLIRLNQAAVLE
jgi:SNF2 family DNA or RNA helicase